MHKNLNDWAKLEIDNLKSSIKKTITKSELIKRKEIELFIKLSLILIINNSYSRIKKSINFDQYKLLTLNKIKELNFNNVKLLSTDNDINDAEKKHISNAFDKQNYTLDIKIKSNFFIFYLLNKYFNNDQKIIESLKETLKKEFKFLGEEKINLLLHVYTKILKSEINNSYEKKYIEFINNLSSDDLLIISNNIKFNESKFNLAILNDYGLINKILENNIPIILIEKHKLKNYYFKNICSVILTSFTELDMDLIKLICNKCVDFRDYDLKKIKENYFLTNLLGGDDFE